MNVDGHAVFSGRVVVVVVVSLEINEEAPLRRGILKYGTRDRRKSVKLSESARAIVMSVIVRVRSPASGCAIQS